jgi:hypothetical protein
MLLRVAAVASASALAAACSSGSSGGTTSLGVLDAGDSGAFEDDATTACGGGHFCGSLAGGSVAVPPDAALDAPDDGPTNSYADALGFFDVLPTRDAGEDADARLPCGTGVCGTIVMPQDAAHE